MSRFQEASRVTRLGANQCMVFPPRPDVAVRRSRGGTEAACLPLWQPPPEIPRWQILQQEPLEILGAAQAGRTWRDALPNARMSLCPSTKQGKSEPLTHRVVGYMSSTQRCPFQPSFFLPLTCLRPVVSTQSSLSWTPLDKY